LRLLGIAAVSLAVAAAGHAAAAPSWPGPPRTAVPRVAGTSTVPPPVWVETPRHSSWLGYASFCWSRPAGNAACVDFIPPKSRNDLPLVRAQLGVALRFHLRFALSRLSVSFLGKRAQNLAASRVSSWSPARSGIVLLSARSASGQEASYVFRLSLISHEPRAGTVPGLLDRGRWICVPAATRRVCGGPVRIGVRYRYVLRTHCGIFDAYFAGRLWRASPPLSDGSGNPPRGWDNPEALGTMRLVRADLAEFRQNAKLVARFTPAPRDWKTVICD
jgi:hypothetical protein